MPRREHEEQPNNDRQPSRLEESIAKRLGDRRPKFIAGSSSISTKASASATMSSDSPSSVVVPLGVLSE